MQKKKKKKKVLDRDADMEFCHGRTDIVHVKNKSPWGKFKH